MKITFRIATACAAFASIVIVIIVARGGTAVTPVSDTAVIESYTLYASRAQLLVGPYSRYGWHHPGPIYFYLLAPVYVLAGRSTPGLSAGALLINIAAFAVLVGVLVRSASSLLTMAVAAATLLYAWRLPPLLVSPWNPHVVVLPLAALAVVTAAVATGEVGLLPVGVGFASFVVQTHVGVAPTALAFAAVLIAAAWRARGIAAGRRGFIAAVAIAAAFWAVPFFEQLSAEPGNMTAIARFFSTPDRGHQTVAATFAAWSDMVTGVERPDFHIAGGSPFRRSRWRPARTVAALEIAALAAIALIARRRRQRFDAALASVLLLGLAVAFAAVTRIHDEIIDHEVFWISGLGAVAAGTIAANALSAVFRPSRSPMVAFAAATSCLVVAAIGMVELRDVARRTQDPAPERRAAAVLGNALSQRVRATGGRPLIRIDQNEWSVAAGALLELQRNRLQFAVADDWLPMFTARARATGAETEEIAITGRSGNLLLTADGMGKTIGAADPFYAVVLGARTR